MGAAVVLHDDHEAFRASVREFLRRSVVGHVEAWDDAGIIPREPWLEAGRQGSWASTLRSAT
ncbi:acyl-CoA dehydrogenase family protein [Dactylosporangium cerinum]|uniref:Acyl-CoA dehydrogenase family protein n=1 Tax=Dactylosporangium cerinum TaxID=1434730 RepID=A0ABV9WD86_9ACTN